MTNTKQSISSLCNYTLYVHAVLHDYDKARGLYSKLVEFMNQRGVDNAFVLYSYAIFCAVTNEEDWDGVCVLYPICFLISAVHIHHISNK